MPRSKRYGALDRKICGLMWRTRKQSFNNFGTTNENEGQITFNSSKIVCTSQIRSVKIMPASYIHLLRNPFKFGTIW